MNDLVYYNGVEEELKFAALVFTFKIKLYYCLRREHGIKLRIRINYH